MRFRVRSQLALLAPRNDSVLLTASLPRSRGAEAPGLWVFPAPSFRKEGARNAGRQVRPQPRVQSCRKHTSVVTTKAPYRPAFRTRWSVGLLRALPGNGRNLLAVVSAGSRRRPDLDASAADRISVGTTRFGPPRKAIRMGRISTPVRTAQRRRPPRCPASRGCRLQSGPCGRRSSAGPRPGRRTAARRCRVHRIPPREP
jgi:hypothetical protein